MVPDVTHILRADAGPPRLATYREQAKRPLDPRVVELVAGLAGSGRWRRRSPEGLVRCPADVRHAAAGRRRVVSSPSTFRAPEARVDMKGDPPCLEML